MKVGQSAAGLPWGIGPHEGQEFALLLAGAKQVAYFADYQPEALVGFVQGHAEFGWLMWRSFHAGRPFDSHVVFRRGFEDWACQLIALVQSPPRGMDAEHERRVGMLLSYSEEEIDAWLDWLRTRLDMKEHAT